MLNLTNTSSLFFTFLAANNNGGLPWWVWLIIIILVILLLWYLWRWFTRSKSTTSLPTPPSPAVKATDIVTPKPAVKAVDVATPKPVVPPVGVVTSKPAVQATEAAIPVPASPVKPDDLTLIEGIGPKIASLLQAAGITTFTQLAEVDISRVAQILKDAGLQHLADPTTWGEQAKLAAAGKWEEFKTLTDSLKGGRRVS